MFGSSLRALTVAISTALLATACGMIEPQADADSGRELAGTRWLAEDIDGRGVIDFAQSTLEFESNQRALANGGCNSAFGDVRFNGDRLELGAFGATMRMCPPAVMDQERRFFDALAVTHRYRLDTTHNKLYLLDSDNREILRFSRTASLDTEPIDD